MNPHFVLELCKIFASKHLISVIKFIYRMKEGKDYNESKQEPSCGYYWIQTKTKNHAGDSATKHSHKVPTQKWWITRD